MRYDVKWDDDALDKLADLWMRASDRDAIRDAANQVDRELAWSPETKGNDFYGDRLLVISPLQVSYSIDPARGRVTVLDVW